MAYVNQDPNRPPPAPKLPLDFQNFAQLAQWLVHPRLRSGLLLALIALLAGIVVLLALAPPYAGLAGGLDLQPARLLAPLYTYLFRNAVINVGLLLVGVYLVALFLGWTWAITGISPQARPFLLVPLFIPGALVGLLWRPLFAGWLDLAHMQISLVVTALVLLWRTVPLAAWYFSRDRDAWPKFMALCALLILLDGAFVLTLTRGEPFNAAHTWPSWLLQQLWVNRAWGYGASMGGALALTLAALTWWATHPTPAPLRIPHGSPLGLTVLLLWLAGPLLMPLFAFLQSPLHAINDLIALGALRWLVNGALLWAVTTLGARALVWPLSTARAQQLARTLAVAMLPITLIAVAYLTNAWPLLRGLWLLIILTSLFTAGLLLGSTPLAHPHPPRWTTAAGYAALVLACTFALQIVLQLPAHAWTPALGVTWTLAEAPQASAALGLSLVLFGVWAGLGAWLADDTKYFVPTRAHDSFLNDKR